MACVACIEWRGLSGDADQRPVFTMASRAQSRLHGRVESAMRADAQVRRQGPELCQAFLAHALAIAERTRSDIDSWKHNDAREHMLLERGEAYARWTTPGCAEPTHTQCS